MLNTMPKAIAVIAALSASITISSAQADTKGPSVSASLTGATEYVWRGVEQSAGDPAIFAAVNVSLNGFYFGAGAENVDFLDIDTEYDLWAGWTTTLKNGPTLDFGVVRYGYIDAPSNLDLDTVELKAAISQQFGDVTFGASIMFTDDFFATEESAQHIELTGSKPLSEKWNLSGAIGHQMLEDDTGNYTHWNIGAAYAVSDTVSLDFRYTDTDADYLGGAADQRFVIAFSVGL